MPTYEYECEKCGHRFELFQRMSDPPRKRCPKCRGKVRRLLGTGAGMIFKGSGFYTTDYRSDSYKQQQKKESGDSHKKPDEAKPKRSGKGGSKPSTKPGSSDA
ncbi:MAG TPA: FmdB family zinc ribbon protein [Candidatus Eisenbacteria bacterium]